MKRIDLTQFDGALKGPWKFFVRPEYVNAVVQAKYGRTVAEVWSAIRHPTVQQAEANARLIAAGPTLVDALREAYAEIDRLTGVTTA
jgi:hypothetical protein